MHDTRGMRDLNPLRKGERPDQSRYSATRIPVRGGYGNVYVTIRPAGGKYGQPGAIYTSYSHHPGCIAATPSVPPRCIAAVVRRLGDMLTPTTPAALQPPLLGQEGRAPDRPRAGGEFLYLP